jgi:carboxyl-terminal processing protease
VLADGRVGYLRVDTFSAGAADDFHARLREQLDAGITDLVIDLRDDPGGFVDAAVTMASEFLGGGIVYQEEQADGERRVVEARPGGLATDSAIDVAVLIDGGTASASEIVAGALGDRARATLVGERTFGKGTIQEWTELPGDNGGFRLSIARWLLPDGTSIDGVGVAPDVEVAEPSATTPLEDDPVVVAAIEVLLAEEEGVADPSPSAMPVAVPTAASAASPSTPPAV